MPARFAATLNAFATFAALLGLLLLARATPSEELVAALKTWIGAWGAWGWLGFLVIYVVATLLFVPGWILTVVAGTLYGLVGGTLLVSGAATASAALAFLIARHLARKPVARYLDRYPKFRAIDQAVETEGWKLVALLRLSPGVPFALQNYLYGVTAIRFWPCVLTSAWAMLPGTLMYIYIGYLGGVSLQALAADRTVTWGRWALAGLGLLAVIAVTIYLTRLAQRAMSESMALATPELPAAASNAHDLAPHRRRWLPLVSVTAALAILLAGVWANLEQARLRQFVEQQFELNVDPQ